jgi:hypothetical protein
MLDENTDLGTVRTDKGDVVGARYLIAAAGNLSATNVRRSRGSAHSRASNITPAIGRATASTSPPSGSA